MGVSLSERIVLICPANIETSQTILPRLDGLWRSGGPHEVNQLLTRLDASWASVSPTDEEMAQVETFVQNHMNADSSRRIRFLQILHHLTPYVTEPLALEALEASEVDYLTSNAEGAVGILAQLRGKEATLYTKKLIEAHQKPQAGGIPYTLGAMYETLANKPHPEAIDLLKKGLDYCRTNVRTGEEFTINEARKAALTGLVHNEQETSMKVLLNELKTSVGILKKGQDNAEAKHLFWVVKAILAKELPLVDRQYDALKKLLYSSESRIIYPVLFGMLPNVYKQNFDFWVKNLNSERHYPTKHHNSPWNKADLQLLRAIVAIFHNRAGDTEQRIVSDHIDFGQKQASFYTEREVMQLAQDAMGRMKSKLPVLFDTTPFEFSEMDGVTNHFRYTQ